MSVQRLLYTFLVCCFVSTVSLYAQSEKQKKLEAERQQILREIDQMNALLFSKKKAQKSEITQIEDLTYKLNVRQNLIRITNEQTNLLTREINTNQNEITSLRTQLQELKDDYAAMIVKSYKSKSQQSKVMFLLSSENFKQAYKRLQYINQYKDYQKKQAEIIKSKTQELQALNLRLSEQKASKQKLIAANKADKKKLEQELKLHETLMASIKADMGKYNAQIRQKRQEISELDKAIDKLIREAIVESNTNAGNSTSSGTFALTPAEKIVGTNFEANKGNLGWPVTRGIIKGKFGKRRSLTDASVTNNYKSIYIATEENAEVKAVFDGEVTAIHIMKRGNPTVMIRHGNYFTVYNNLSVVNVEKGDKVKTGQVIGKAFTNKIKGETLIGFRIYKNDKVVNPEYWLSKR